MPQISVEHSRGLDFDRRGFAAELHPVVAELIDTTVEACKTRFHPADEEFLGDGDERRRAVYVEIRILAGRPPALRTELSERALAVLEKYVPGERLHLAVNVVELDHDVYRATAR